MTSPARLTPMIVAAVTVTAAATAAVVGVAATARTTPHQAGPVSHIDADHYLASLRAAWQEGRDATPGEPCPYDTI